CNDCGQRFGQSTNLLQHRCTHTGEKPFSCTACGQSFSCSSHLKRHNKIHHGDGP
ncbi:ZN436 protein, partial [Bucorvus abyssinicus]|nr:ZN436 protein [Bucorvus abyssinicus]